jgi:Deoxycytidylate deaminase
MSTAFPIPFRYAREECKKSTLKVKVGACLVVGKSIIRGHNKGKTHPEFANPEKHIRKTLHAELDCFVGLDRDLLRGGEMYVWREIEGEPALSRPCNHCMSFLKEQGVTKIYYSIAHFPYWDAEEI